MVTHARHLLVAGIGATLLVGLLAAGAASAASSSTANGSNPHPVFVVQHDATMTIGATSTTRSYRLVVAGALLSISSLAAVAARGMAACRRHAPRRRRGSFHARLRAPPSRRLVFAH
jgi:hypothetical protein